MKKFSVILLIAVLAMTSVFADAIGITGAISGSATASYTIDCADGGYGYTNPEGDNDLVLAISVSGATKTTEAEKEGFWAEMTASYTFSAKKLYFGDKYAFNNGSTYGLDITTFAIHYADKITWNLLKATSVGNYAKSTVYAYDAKDEASAETWTSYYTFDDGLFATALSANGTTLTWNGYTFSAAVNADAIKKGATKNYYTGVETPKFTIAKGLTFQGAGIFRYAQTAAVEAKDAVKSTTAKKVWVLNDHSGEVKEADIIAEDKVNFSYDPTDALAFYAWTYDKTTGEPKVSRLKQADYYAITTPAVEAKDATKLWTIGGSLKLGYASEDGNIAITAATDQAIAFGKNVDATSNPSVADRDVRYDADLALNLTFKPAVIDVYYAKEAQVNAYTTKRIGYIKNFLTAKAVIDLTNISPVSVEIEGLNLLHRSPIFSTTVGVKLGENYTLTAYAKDILGTKSNYNDAITTHTEAKTFYQQNYQGQKVGLAATMKFGAVTVAPEVWYRIALKELGHKINVTYTNANFEVTAGVNGYFLADEGKKVKETGLLKASAGIESETVVKGATVGFSYASKNLLTRAHAFDNLAVFTERKESATEILTGAGSATFYCTIEF